MLTPSINLTYSGRLLWRPRFVLPSYLSQKWKVSASFKSRLHVYSKMPFSGLLARPMEKSRMSWHFFSTLLPCPFFAINVLLQTTCLSWRFLIAADICRWPGCLYKIYVLSSCPEAIALRELQAHKVQVDCSPCARMSLRAQKRTSRVSEGQVNLMYDPCLLWCWCQVSRLESYIDLKIQAEHMW